MIRELGVEEINVVAGGKDKKKAYQRVNPSGVAVMEGVTVTAQRPITENQLAGLAIEANRAAMAAAAVACIEAGGNFTSSTSVVKVPVSLIGDIAGVKIVLKGPKVMASNANWSCIQ